MVACDIAVRGVLSLLSACVGLVRGGRHRAGESCLARAKTCKGTWLCRAGGRVRVQSSCRSKPPSPARGARRRGEVSVIVGKTTFPFVWRGGVRVVSRFVQLTPTACWKVPKLASIKAAAGSVQKFVAKRLQHGIGGFIVEDAVSIDKASFSVAIGNRFHILSPYISILRLLLYSVNSLMKKIITVEASSWVSQRQYWSFLGSGGLMLPLPESPERRILRVAYIGLKEG